MEIKREFYDIGGQRSATWAIGAMSRDNNARVYVFQWPDLKTMVRECPVLLTLANITTTVQAVPEIAAAIAQMLAEAQAQAETWDKDTGKPWTVEAGKESE